MALTTRYPCVSIPQRKSPNLNKQEHCRPSGPLSAFNLDHIKGTDFDRASFPHRRQREHQHVSPVTLPGAPSVSTTCVCISPLDSFCSTTATTTGPSAFILDRVHASVKDFAEVAPSSREGLCAQLRRLWRQATENLLTEDCMRWLHVSNKKLQPHVFTWHCV